MDQEVQHLKIQLQTAAQQLTGAMNDVRVLAADLQQARLTIARQQTTLAERDAQIAEHAAKVARECDAESVTKAA